VLGHEFRDEAWVKVIDVAWLGGRYYRDCLTLIERSLGE